MFYEYLVHMSYPKYTGEVQGPPPHTGGKIWEGVGAEKKRGKWKEGNER